MKRFIAVVLMLFVASVAHAGFLDETLFDVTATITTLGTDAPSTVLLKVPVGADAGLVLSLDCDSDLSDDYTTYIFREDIANWYTNDDKDDRTKNLYPPYDSSTTDWTDTDPFPFSSDNQAIYIGVYNDDAAATASFKINIKGKYYKHKTLTDVADTD